MLSLKIKNDFLSGSSTLFCSLYSFSSFFAAFNLSSESPTEVPTLNGHLDSIFLGQKVFSTTRFLVVYGSIFNDLQSKPVIKKMAAWFSSSLTWRVDLV